MEPTAQAEIGIGDGHTGSIGCDGSCTRYNRSEHAEGYGYPLKQGELEGRSGGSVGRVNLMRGRRRDLGCGASSKGSAKLAHIID